MISALELAAGSSSTTKPLIGFSLQFGLYHVQVWFGVVSALSRFVIKQSIYLSLFGCSGMSLLEITLESFQG